MYELSSKMEMNLKKVRDGLEDLAGTYCACGSVKITAIPKIWELIGTIDNITFENDIRKQAKYMRNPDRENLLKAIEN